MNMAPMIWLVAVFAAPLHAQVCSGGADGGIDATGNLCSNAALIRLYADVPYIVSTAPTVKLSESHPTTASTDGQRSTMKISASPATLSVVMQTSKVEALNVSPCAGGPGGGMDATGNECSEYPVARMNEGVIVAAKL